MKRNRWLQLLAVLAVSVSLYACGTGDSGGDEQAQDRIPVIMPKQEYLETPRVDYSLSGLPEFVDDISQFVDTQKQYVTPNGYLWVYGQRFVPSAENQLPLAVDKEGTVFEGCGYRDNARIRGVLEIGETDYSFVTGFIPAKAGDVIYFSGNCFQPKYVNAHIMHIILGDYNRETVLSISMQEAETYFEILETNEYGFATALQVREDVVPGNVVYVRFTLIGSGAQQIISVNEPLDEGREVTDWVQQGQYISSDWCREIDSTVETLNGIKLDDLASAIRFVFATDIHVDPDPSASYTNNLGKVCAEVMHSCGIPFFATGGDNCTQSSGYMPTVFKENMKVLLQQLEPIPQRNILLSVGNHDGATGSCEENGETVFYRYQLSNEERSSVFFDWQRETNEYKHFDSDGTYYYIDDSVTKTRYIILNSFWSQWEGDEYGFVSDVQHSLGHNPHFGPQQLKWFASEALDMPPNYGAIIITHFAPDAKDFAVFKGIVDAFSNRSTYEGSYVGTEEWQSTQIAVNYRYADGEIIAVFQGHNHEDALHDFFETVPCVNITTAGAYWATRGETALERVKGTSSEFAVDVVTVDRDKRIIYLTRLGAGDDRIIPY